MRYQVEFYDPTNGATTPIDTIEKTGKYTAEDYIKDCEENADQDWIDMIHSGTITLIPID